MFHGKHDDDALRRAATYSGIALTKRDLELLGRYGRWLGDEAVSAGAIGPAEPSRIVDRHLADSLVFAQAWHGTPQTLLDVGSGAGLPGIPLAITHAGTGVTLLDRAGRRTDLLRRVVRILELANVTIEEADAATTLGTYDVAVFRASVPPATAVALTPRLVGERGMGVVGLRRGSEPPDLPPAPEAAVLELLETPDGVLDSPAWHLRMTLR